MLQIHALPAFEDNYFWVIRNNQSVVVVDPGDARIVIEYLEHNNLQLEAILVTHHHGDHVGGVIELVERAATLGQPIKVYGAQSELKGLLQHSRALEQVWLPVEHRQVVSLKVSDQALSLQLIHTPGHTLGHMVYYCAALDALFCADTLFASGCGRLFEGTALQMLQSLQSVKALPPQTRVYCAHEYTLNNIRFARTVEPLSSALEQWQRDAQQMRSLGLPTVPTTLAHELRCNPFLRTNQPAVITAAQQFLSSHNHLSEEEVFAAIRRWKDQFK